MAARAIWKGELKLGNTKLPVKLYSAVEDRSVRFHILDRSRTRVKQHMVEPDTGKEVPNEEIRKGYEIEQGRGFTAHDLETGAPVAILGSEVVSVFFGLRTMTGGLSRTVCGAA